MSETVKDVEKDPRHHKRLRTYQGGMVLIDNTSTFNCVIKSRSEKGFGLKFGSTNGVPEEFLLKDDKTGQTHLCRVVWRKKQAMGVEVID